MIWIICVVMNTVVCAHMCRELRNYRNLWHTLGPGWQTAHAQVVWWYLVWMHHVACIMIKSIWKSYGFVQNCSISRASAMEILPFCSKTSIYCKRGVAENCRTCTASKYRVVMIPTFSSLNGTGGCHNPYVPKVQILCAWLCCTLICCNYIFLVYWIPVTDLYRLFVVN